MSSSCTPILVGVVSSVSEIWLPFKNGQISLSGHGLYFYHKRQGKAWYSPPFYSEPGGYKFCLRIDPNGMLEGKESHLLVWVYIMRGRFDESLKWPFTGKVTVQLYLTGGQIKVIFKILYCLMMQLGIK